MTEPIRCRDAVHQLWGYLDGALGAGNREALESHLAWCLRCCGELDFARELRGLLERRSTPPLPDDVADRLERFVDHLDDPSGPTSPTVDHRS